MGVPGAGGGEGDGSGRASAAGEGVGAVAGESGFPSATSIYSCRGGLDGEDEGSIWECPWDGGAWGKHSWTGSGVEYWVVYWYSGSVV